MNRIETAIQKTIAHVQKRQELGLVTAEKIIELHKHLDMQFDEYIKFQELKSLAFANGRINLEEAETIYGYLGNTVEHFNKQTVFVKATLTNLFKELLQERIKS